MYSVVQETAGQVHVDEAIEKKVLESRVLIVAEDIHRV